MLQLGQQLQQEASLERSCLVPKLCDGQKAHTLGKQAMKALCWCCSTFFQIQQHALQGAFVEHLLESCEPWQCLPNNSKAKALRPQLSRKPSAARLHLHRKPYKTHPQRCRKASTCANTAAWSKVQGWPCAAVAAAACTYFSFHARPAWMLCIKIPCNPDFQHHVAASCC